MPRVRETDAGKIVLDVTLTRNAVATIYDLLMNANDTGIHDGTKYARDIEKLEDFFSSALREIDARS